MKDFHEPTERFDGILLRRHLLANGVEPAGAEPGQVSRRQQGPRTQEVLRWLYTPSHTLKHTMGESCSPDGTLRLARQRHLCVLLQEPYDIGWMAGDIRDPFAEATVLIDGSNPFIQEFPFGLSLLRILALDLKY